jgi:hypothetical protein
MVYMRGDRGDFDHWRDLGNEGWGWADVLPYFKKSEDFVEGVSIWHGRNGPLTVSAQTSPHPLALAFVDAALACGHRRNPDFNGEQAEGAGLYHVTIRDSQRCSTAAEFLHPVRQRANLRIVTHTRALRVLLAGDRAVGVEAFRAGEVFRIHARREIILSAGAIDSPKLLMLSGIGDPAPLQDLHIQLTHALPGVGAGLVVDRRTAHLLLTGPTMRELAAMDAKSMRVAVSGPVGGRRVIEIFSLQDDRLVASLKPVELEGAFGSGVRAMTFFPDGKLLAVATSEGTPTLWDVTREAWVAKLDVFGDGTQVSIDPAGRFDTNRLEDIRQLHWVLADERLRARPLEIFVRQYYEPRLLSRLLAGETFPPVRALDQINRAQPRVGISSITPSGDGRVSVTVEVATTRDAKGRNGGAPDLRLFRAGQLVARQPAAPGPLIVDCNGVARARFDLIRLPTSAGPVDFSAYAFNVDAVKSETAHANHEVPGGTRAQPGRAYLVAIGVNACENPDWNLQFAANDAQEMLKTLGDGIRKTKRYEKVVAVPLIAARAGDRQATRAQIEAVLRKLAGQPAD